MWRAQRSLLAESSKMLRLITIHNAYRPLAQRILHKLSTSLHNEKDNNMNKFKIEECRRQVPSLLAQSMTESEIAQELNVDVYH